MIQNNFEDFSVDERDKWNDEKKKKKTPEAALK
jgi:hypothetical protein